MQATLDRLISDQKTFPNARQLAGDLYFQLHDLDNAYQQYAQGDKENPKQHRPYTKRMIEVLAQQNKIPEATALAAQLMKEDPKDAEATSMHATLELQDNDRTKAKHIISELQPLVTRDPKSPILHFNLARAYIVQGDRRQQRTSPAPIGRSCEALGRSMHPPSISWLYWLLIDRISPRRCK